MKQENQEKQFLNSEQNDKNPDLRGTENNDIYTAVTRSLENVSHLESNISAERWQKRLLQENLADVATTLREGGVEDPLNVLIAYRGLEHIKNQHDLEQDDFGIREAMEALRGQLKGVEGFDIEEADDLDAMLKQSGSEVKNALQQDIEQFSVEEAVKQKNKFDRYFALKQEIQKRQREILGGSQSFYRGISEKISGPLISFLKAQGEKIDNSMRDSRVSLLRYVGKYNMGSKVAQGIGISIITAGALGYVFKGELAEAAQHSTHATELQPVSPQELKAKDPEMYHLLQEYGLIQKTGLELNPESPPTHQEKERYKNMPVIFKKALKDTDATSLLETPAYKKADTIPKLQELYRKFNEKDDDPSDNLAVMAKYHEFLSAHSQKELTAEYGKKETSEFLRQAGFVTHNSLKKYFEKDMEDGGVKSEVLSSYLEGFVRAANFYKQSLAIGEKYTKEKGMHRAFSGLIEINNTLSTIANTIMMYGGNADKITAASMRMEAHRNLKEFKSIQDRATFIGLGDERFLISDTKTLAKFLKSYIASEIYENWVNVDGEAGVGFPTTSFAEQTNKILRKERVSKTDKDLIELLLSEKIILQTKTGIIANPEKPVLLFTTLGGYNHENQHHETKKNPEIVAYWTKEWNKLSESEKKSFALELWDVGYFRFLSRQEVANAAKQNLSPKEMVRANADILQGKAIADLDLVKNLLVQEFMAYSTDNDPGVYFNPKYELPFKELSFD